jgi:multidrug resistance efflux pump
VARLSSSAVERFPEENCTSEPVEQFSSADTDKPLENVVIDAIVETSHQRLSRPENTVQLELVVSDETAQAWLKAQCEMITGTTLGIVLESASHTEDVQLLARWPHSCSTIPKTMLDAAHSASRDQTVVIVSSEYSDSLDDTSEPARCFVATPLQKGDSVGSVAVFELPNSILQQQQAIIQLLQWGAVWYGLLKRKQVSGSHKDRLTTVIELLAGSLEHATFNSAATSAVTELATHIGCTRVSLGLLHGSSMRVCAISNSTRVDMRMNLTRDIGAAMNEAVDQDATLSWPRQFEGLPYVTYAQEVLARHAGCSSVMSTPLYDGPTAIGALTLERDCVEGFDQQCKDICESLAVLLGPIIALKHDKERTIVYKIWESLRDLLARLCGRKHVALKLYGLIALASLTFLSIATGDYRITAQARLEGSVKRVITAPLDGFVASSEYRAGDIVQSGDLLARLDDRELRLEQLHLNSQREQLDIEHRAAMTNHDRSATAIVTARKQQTGAQLTLIEEQLLRTQLTAPFDGIVVSGDLSQRIGSPVENGQVLFEIAPLNNYRVVLEVDERDIGDIVKKQRGVLTLTSLPDSTLVFTVNRIVPLSTPRDGRNVFEVQAELELPNEIIRPGMEGIGKIEGDRRTLIWVWTHELIDWLRLSVWTWIS